jgi:hypothetical protein
LIHSEISTTFRIEVSSLGTADVLSMRTVAWSATIADPCGSHANWSTGIGDPHWTDRVIGHRSSSLTTPSHSPLGTDLADYVGEPITPRIAPQSARASVMVQRGVQSI